MKDEPLEITISGGVHSFFDFSSSPPGTLETFNKMLAESEAVFDENNQELAGRLWDEALAFAEPWRRPTGPAPTAPSTPPPELIEDRDEAIAICTSPDVCKTPVGSSTPAIPYMVTGRAGDDDRYTSTVRSNGYTVKHANSRFTTTYGDEAGTVGGVVSGTVGGIVEPTGSSPIVRVEGNPIVRHRDPCTLNNGNCHGEYSIVVSNTTSPAPDGNDAQDRAWYKKFGDEFYDHSGTAQDVGSAWNRGSDYWDDPSLIGDDLKSAWDAVPSASEAWSWTKDAASGVAAVAKDVWNDPRGSADAAGQWTKDTASGVADATGEIYNRSGVLGVVGAGFGVAGEVFSPSQKVRAASAATEVLDEAGNLARRRRRREGDDDPPERRDEEEGDDGTRSTARLHRVPCFDMPPGLDPVEYDRQLAEQMSVINNMTADDMAYAHWVLDRAGGTSALRDPGAQARHRTEYRDMLRASTDMTNAEINAHMSGLHATHFLDMIAGGHPTAFSRDAAGRPILGDGAVNSDIGNRWTKQGRAASLGEEAERMRRSGRAGDNLNVELRRC